jgi:hypothetical protein
MLLPFVDVVMDGFNLPFPTSGSLSGANQALPWIVCKRDWKIFEVKHSVLRIKEISPLMPSIYLLSGWLKNSLTMPAFSYSFWGKAEQRLFSEEKKGMFGLDVLKN